jgi:fibronectin type 3 domain-containing protein
MQPAGGTPAGPAADTGGTGVSDAIVSASLTAEPSTVTAGETVTLNASGTTGPDTYSYVFDFEGDGTFDTAFLSVQSVDHTYSTAGTYEPVVRVYDGSDLVATATANLTVEQGNQAPTADLSVPSTVTVGQVFEVDASGSSDPDGDALTYDYDLDGDGTYEVNDSTDPTEPNTFQSAQTVAVGVRVDDGNATDTAQATVEVVPEASSAGDSLELDGRGFGTTPDTDALDFSGRTMTVEFWVNPNASADENALIMRKNGAFQVQWTGTGEERQIYFDMDGFEGAITSDSGVPAGAWTHVAVVFDGTQKTVYLNGTVDQQFSQDSGTSSSGNALVLGSNDAGNGQYFAGDVDNVRMWDTSRSLFEIEGNLYSEVTGTESGLLAAYQFDGASGGTVTDVASDGGSNDQNDLSLQGDAEVADRNANPVAPHLTAEPRDSGVTLTWTHRTTPSGGNDVSEYRIYRSTDRQGANRQLVGVVGPSRRGYFDYDVRNDRTYFYEVTGVDSTGEGDYSKATPATPYGDATVRAEAGFAGGGGGSLGLPGRGYATVTDRESLDFEDRTMTLEFWVKPDASSDADAYILDKEGAFSVQWRETNAEGGEERRIDYSKDGFEGEITSDSGVPAGVWTHVAIVFDGSQKSIYLNGTLDQQFTQDESPSDSGNDLRIGSNTAGNDKFFAGNVDEFRVWDDARTDSEIKDSYADHLSADASDLNAYWQFDEVGASEAVGSSKRHATATLGGDARLERGGALPVSPHAHAESNNGSATVTWTPRADGSIIESGYRIYRSSSLSNDDRTLVATLDNQSRRTFVDTNVSNDETYYYEVTTVGTFGQESDFSWDAVASPYADRGGASLSLDGQSSAVVTDRESLDFEDRTMTLEFWVKPDASSDADAYILRKNNAFGVKWDGDGEDRKIDYDKDGFEGEITSNGGVPAGEWSHVAIVFDGNNKNIYINGELDAQWNQDEGLSDSANDLRIGSNAAGNGQFFAGNVDEVAVWQDARTDAEIERSYNRELTGDEQGLSHYWQFDARGAAAGRSTEETHATVQLRDNAAISAPGVLPVPPRVYARSGGATADVSWEVRSPARTSEVTVYESSQRDLSDRSAVATVDTSRQSTYEVSNLTNGATAFYQATATNADGQESDYGFEAGALPSTLPAGNAFRLYGNGTNSYAKVGDRPALDIASDGTFSVEFWVRFETGTDTDAYVLDKPGAYSAWLAGDGPQRKLAFDVRSFEGFVQSSGDLTAGTWHHVAVVYDGNDKNIYIDGQLDTQQFQDEGAASSSNDLTVGANGATNQFILEGDVDELRLWDDARTPSEVTGNYDNELSGAEQGLVGYWRGPFTTDNDTVTGNARRPTTLDLTNVGAVDSGASVETGGSGSTTVTVSLDGAPDGLRLYSIELSNGGGELVTSVEPDLVSGQQFEIASGGPGSSSVRARALEITSDSGTFSDKQTLFTATYAGNVTEADLSVTVSRLEDDSGNDIDPSNVVVEVGAGAGGSPFSSPLPGETAPPADPDGDGLYEDVDGSGSADFGDVLTLAFNLDASFDSAQTNAFDFDGSGTVDFGDVISLAFNI